MELMIKAAGVYCFVLAFCACLAVNGQKQYQVIDSLIYINDFDKAEKNIKSEFAGSPGSFDFNFLMGKLNRQKKDFDASEFFFQKCILIDPSKIKPYGNLAVLNKIKGNYDEAMIFINRGLRIDSTVVDFINEKAILFYEKSEYETALVYLKKAHELSPGDSYFIYNIGTCLNLLNRSDEAIAFFDRAWEMSPTDAKIYYDRGLSYYYLNMPEKAIIDFRNALKYNKYVVEDYERPKYSHIFRHISKCYKMERKPFRAAYYSLRSLGNKCRMR